MSLVAPGGHPGGTRIASLTRPARGGAPALFLRLARMNLVIIRRNRQILVFNILVPLLMILIFGGLFQSHAAEVAVAGPPRALAVLRSALPRRSFRVERLTAAAARRAVADGSAAVALIVPTHGGRPLPVTVVENAANVTDNGSRTAVAEAAVARLNQALLGTAPAAVPVVATVAAAGGARSTTLAGNDYIQFLTPGVLAYAVFTAGVLGAALRTVSDRERGTLRRVRATPVPIGIFLAAQILAQLVLVVVQVVVLLGVARAVYGVGIGPQPWSLALLTLIGALCFLAFGFLIAGVARGEQAALTIGNLFSLPQLFVAGIFFPISQSPSWLQALSAVMPLRYFSDGLRGLMAEGQSLGAVGVDVLVLAGLGIVALVVAGRTFRFDPVGASR